MDICQPLSGASGNTTSAFFAAQPASDGFGGAAAPPVHDITSGLCGMAALAPRLLRFPIATVLAFFLASAWPRTRWTAARPPLGTATRQPR